MRPSAVDLPNVEGWDVISADAVRVGRVHDVEEGFLVVEIVPTLHAAGEHAGRPQAGEILPGEHDTTRLTDPDPTVAETDIYTHANAGARQHAGDIPAAVPRDRPRDRDANEGAGRLVRIPASQVRVREGEDRVFLETLRSQEVASLP
ncbi:MAG TPA: hypothetical protein VN493_10310 [Thermoanaerobaculia bacterium]|nr:hypothetical protein [Thermoanaerobaculia bacterium]